jgi:hypothetical protein
MSNLTNEQYWAAQDPRVQAIRSLVTPDGLPDIDARTLLSEKLYDQGFAPDKAIWIWGWDAGKVMATRVLYGATSVLDAVKGLRTIPVDANGDDFKPFNPLPPVPATAPVGEIGARNGFMYAATDQVKNPDGSYKHPEGFSVLHVDADNPNGITLYFHLGGSIFGIQAVWLMADIYQQYKATGAV